MSFTVATYGTYGTKKGTTKGGTGQNFKHKIQRKKGKQAAQDTKNNKIKHDGYKMEFFKIFVALQHQK